MPAGGGSAVNAVGLPAHDDRRRGLRGTPTGQFGNTCYCNSILVALYFCKPFRLLAQRYQPLQPNDETLLTCLADLYNKISGQKRRQGSIAPRKFIAKLKKENGGLLGVPRLRPPRARLRRRAAVSPHLAAATSQSCSAATRSRTRTSSSTTC